jgi:hypothetical protein
MGLVQPMRKGTTAVQQTAPFVIGDFKMHPIIHNVA